MGQPRVLDLFFWKMLQGIVSDSVELHVRQLDSKLCAIDGLEPSQHSQVVGWECEKATKAVAHHLSNALLAEDATKSTVADALQGLLVHYAKQHVGAVRLRIREHMQRVNALSKLNAAVGTGEFDVLVQEHEQSLCILVNYPPSELVSALAPRGARIGDLRGVFSPDMTGLIARPSCVRPSSFGVRASALARWLARNKSAVQDACVASINVMRQVIDLPDLHVAWCGVDLVSGVEDQRLRDALYGRPGRKGAVCATWRPPPHLDDGTEERALVLSCPERQETGVRVVRLLAILTSEARLGLLPPRAMAASSLLPVLIRFTAETPYSYGQVVDMKLRPLQEVQNCPLWPDHVVGRKRPHSPRECERETPSPPPLPAQPAAAPPSATPPPLNYAVTPALERDHCILVALSMTLKRAADGRGWAGTDGAISTYRLIAREHLRQFTDASLRQVFQSIVLKLIEMLGEEAPRGSLAWNKTRRQPENRVVGLQFTEEGRAALQRKADWTIEQMRNNGPAYESEWHCSRSARFAARARATKGQRPPQEARQAKRQCPLERESREAGPTNA
jgi:hypothetical protein